ncbi:MAG: DNA translocase FtsK 4TM domain-containing protein [Lachnospiraceae bacterium]|nr:DNA translocase FtsK 4TM domain-containing protein [Lachnospiraceae bacterium]
MAATKGRKPSSSSRSGTGRTGSRSGSGRSSSRGRSNSRSRSRQAADERFSNEVRDEVIFWTGLAICALLFLCNFHLIGKAGNAISSVMFGLFGMLAYLFPIILFFGVLFIVVNIGRRTALVKEICGVGLFLIVDVFLAMIGGLEHIGDNAKSYYAYGTEHIVSGGVLGGSLAKALTKGLGSVGTVCILLILMIICLVLMTERSFMRMITEGSRNLVDNAREGMEYRIERNEELYEQRQERSRVREQEKQEREQRRMDRKRSGVTMDTDLTPDDDTDDDLLETAMETVAAARNQENTPSATKESAAGKGRGKQTGQSSTRRTTMKDMERVRITGLEREIAEDDREFEEILLEEDNFSAGGAVKGQRGEKDSGSKTAQAGSLESAVIAASSFSAEGEQADTAEEKGNLAATQNGVEALKQKKDEMPAEPAVTANEDVAEVRRPAKHRIEIRSDVENILPGADADMDMEEITAALEDAADLYTEENEGTQQPGSMLTPAGQAVSMTRTESSSSMPAAMAVPAVQTQAEKQSAEEKPEIPKPKPKPYQVPPIRFLTKPQNTGKGTGEKELRETALILQQTLETFKVGATVTDISRGPAVTRYELQPGQGVKVSKIVSLTDDLKLALAATDIRIEAPIPGKSAVGIEVPNKENTMVSLRELIESKEFTESQSKLSFAVGKDIGGKVVVTDIAKMPHVLIAGSTGSGKSVCINTLIMSILYKARPEEVKLIMVDPKVVELSVYNGIPHLLLPVVTDPKKAAAALQWGVNEMMDRYKKFEEQGVRDLKGYNKKMETLRDGDGRPLDKLPQIVIIVDELADLMMVAPGEVEDSICRLAQLARAAGIHLVIATQRPSVDVITGLIKANMPSRIAFAVSSGIDSRTILDNVGAEKLLGKGDMLFYPQGYPKPVRVQGAFVSDGEVADVVEFLKEHSGLDEDASSNEILQQISEIGQGGGGGGESKATDERDSYFADAGRFIIEKEKASIGMLQRVFKIGFNRAARIMDQLADYGVVGKEEGTKPRQVLMTMAEFEQLLEEI